MKIERLPSVLNRRGRSRSGHYDDIAVGLFTKPVRISIRSVGWPSSEVDSLIAARISGRDDEEIRELVKQLEGARLSYKV